MTEEESRKYQSIMTKNLIEAMSKSYNEINKDAKENGRELCIAERCAISVNTLSYLLGAKTGIATANFKDDIGLKKALIGVRKSYRECRKWSHLKT